MHARMTAIMLFLLVGGTAATAAGEKSAYPAKPSVATEKTSMGTEDEQAACTPDATRFCSDKLSDTFAVLACLQAHRQRLSKACRHVLEVNGQ